MWRSSRFHLHQLKFLHTNYCHSRRPTTKSGQQVKKGSICVEQLVTFASLFNTSVTKQAWSLWVTARLEAKSSVMCDLSPGSDTRRAGDGQLTAGGCGSCGSETLWRSCSCSGTQSRLVSRKVVESGDEWPLSTSVWSSTSPSSCCRRSVVNISTSVIAAWCSSVVCDWRCTFSQLHRRQSQLLVR